MGLYLEVSKDKFGNYGQCQYFYPKRHHLFPKVRSRLRQEFRVRFLGIISQSVGLENQSLNPSRFVSSHFAFKRIRSNDC